MSEFQVSIMLLDVEKKSRRSAVDLFRWKLFVSSLIGYTYSSVKAGMEHIYICSDYLSWSRKKLRISDTRQCGRESGMLLPGLYNKFLVLSSYILPEGLVNYIGKKMLIE